MRTVSLPLICVRELSATTVSLGDAPDAVATEILMQDSRAVRVVFDKGALLAEAETNPKSVKYQPEAATAAATKFIEKVGNLRECIVCHEEEIETEINGPRRSFAREFVGGFDAAGWDVYSDRRSDYARMKVGEEGGPGDKWKYFENNLTAEAQVCSTYGGVLAVPAAAETELIEQVGSYRKRGRIPFLSWLHPSNGSSLTRCAQPTAGITGGSDADVDYFEKIAHTSPSKDLLIADARPRINAEVNKVKGGGYEDVKTYEAKDMKVELIFFDIENIHRMRESAHAMHKIVSDAISEGVTDVPDIVKRLDRADGTRWKHHINTMMFSVKSIVEAMTQEVPRSVVCHCSDGWDRTSQMTSLSMLCLDPYYRTMKGYAVCVEREWLSAGHKIKDRTWGHKKGEYSPVFLQFLDGTHQLIRQFPMAFEFNEWFLLMLTDMVHCSLFGNFLENADKERLEKRQSETTESIWSYFFDTRRRDQFRSGMYMPTYYEQVMPDSGSEYTGNPHHNLISAGISDRSLAFAVLGNGVLCPKAELKDVFIWRDYFLRWVEDPLRGYPPALRRDQRQLLKKLQRNAEQGKEDADAPEWPAIYADVPAPPRVSSPRPLPAPPMESESEADAGETAPEPELEVAPAPTEAEPEPEPEAAPKVEVEVEVEPAPAPAVEAPEVEAPEPEPAPAAPALSPRPAPEVAEPAPVPVAVVPAPAAEEGEPPPAGAGGGDD